MLPDALPISKYCYVATKDDMTFRGALVGTGYREGHIELRGAQIAEFADGLTEPRWKVLDGPVVIFRENVSYIIERP